MLESTRLQFVAISVQTSPNTHRGLAEFHFDSTSFKSDLIQMDRHLGLGSPYIRNLEYMNSSILFAFSVTTTSLYCSPRYTANVKKSTSTKNHRAFKIKKQNCDEKVDDICRARILQFATAGNPWNNIYNSRENCLWSTSLTEQKSSERIIFDLAAVCSITRVKTIGWVLDNNSSMKKA